MGMLARAMKVTPGTVTAMAKALAAEGLVEHRPRGGVRLTESGRRTALNVAGATGWWRPFLFER